MTQSPDDRDVAALTEAARSLIEQINKLNKGTGDQLVTLTRRSVVNRRISIAMGIAGLLVVAALAVSVVNFQRTADLTDRLDRAQTTQRQKALCPLYGLFLSSKSERGKKMYEQGPAAYENAFKVIEDGYQVLKCDAFISP